MSAITRHGTHPRLPVSNAVEANGWLYVTGQVPRDENGELLAGNMTAQARLTLNNLVKVVTESGYEMKDVVRVGVWIDDPRDFADFNKVFAEFFDIEHAPARVTVQGSMVCDCKIEIDAIAYKES
ncbi:RidA family protein [Halodesulfovibrio marinisediminis]|uniref:Reactive intermediate/imine deaminase n=1 Tax=Halodesulfovibrio marinisediminis DSM 17456 TaxID=1121457 RepID=A0A1N6GRR5_9BACT|nr:RidA family protein [Halodesulfovibrio marinisediminis]SIO10218.1 reactive intermediate/imine deaminase [Halodesulfovibrio marinisediminis DSM 17456]